MLDVVQLEAKTILSFGIVICLSAMFNLECITAGRCNMIRTKYYVASFKSPRESRAGSPNSLKKVDFDLTATTKQDFYEYRRKVKRGKYPKPFDADKKPSQSVLKDSTPTPIHPFFKRAWNINYWTPSVTTSELIENMEGIETDV